MWRKLDLLLSKVAQRFRFRVGGRLPRFASFFLSTVALTLMLTACIADQTAIENTGSSQVAGNAGNNGNASTVTVYTALEDDQIQNYLSSWRAKHPDINVNVVRDSTGVITAKLLAEKANPVADVVWGTAASSLLVAEQEGMLEPYAPAGLDQVNPRFRDQNNPPSWVGIDVWSSAYCVNTIESEKRNLPIPQGWDDLIKPVYKNQLVMANPASSGTGFLTVSAILQTRGEEEGWKYLEALHQNMAQYTHSGSKPCKMAGQGEFPIGISFDYRAVRQKNDGEPIQPVFPKEAGWDVEANALVKKADIKAASKTFLDWAVSPEASELYAKNFGITAVKTAAPLPTGFPANLEENLIDNDLVWAAENRDRILDEWTKRFDSKSEPKT
jgi:iron(III) transport system substrate-binding protein